MPAKLSVHLEIIFALFTYVYDILFKRRASNYAFLLLVILLQAACKKKETEVVPVVTISSLSKTVLNIGDTLSINGDNFNTTPEKNLVSVATISFKVISASSNKLSVVVPKGAQSGTLSVGFALGQATSFNQQITIVGGTQPSITSITPAGAYEGDTIIIKGKNFSIPYDLNSVTFNGTSSGKIINATANELKVVVPDLSDSGPIQVTSGGLNSLPIQYTVSKVDPFEDGHIYWMTPSYAFSDVTYQDEISAERFIKGLTNTGSSQTSLVYQMNSAPFPPNPQYYNSPPFYPELSRTNQQGIQAYSIYNYVVNDNQHNGYYLTSSAYPFPAEYKLMKFNYSSGSGTPAPVWSQTFSVPAYNNFYPDPTSQYSSASIHYTPGQQISIDGNTIYLKMGISDDYYTGDVSATSPVLTLQKGLLGDANGYDLKFGKDYIFYSVVGAPQYQVDPSSLKEVRYVKKGSKVSQLVPLGLIPYTDFVVSTMADASHGNNLLIVTRSNATNLNTIYNFNAETQKLTVLYNKANWADSPSGEQYIAPLNSGFLWAGKHIYYANHRNSPFYTALHRLNDDGSSAKVVTVYGRMEPLTDKLADYFSLFIGK